MNELKFLSINILIVFLNYFLKTIKCYQFFPETYKDNDMFFNEIGKKNNRLVAAKYFTSNSINTYIKNQGFNLEKDDSLEGLSSHYNAWNSMMKYNSLYKELYENSVKSNSYDIIYKFPIQEFYQEKYKITLNE